MNIYFIKINKVLTISFRYRYLPLVYDFRLPIFKKFSFNNFWFFLTPFSGRFRRCSPEKYKYVCIFYWIGWHFGHEKTANRGRGGGELRREFRAFFRAFSERFCADFREIGSSRKIFSSSLSPTTTATVTTTAASH